MSAFGAFFPINIVFPTAPLFVDAILELMAFGKTVWLQLRSVALDQDRGIAWGTEQMQQLTAVL